MKIKNSVQAWLPAAVAAAVISLAVGVPAWAQGEKRTVFSPNDFHWQSNLKAGQSLEVINTNGEIRAGRASGDAARAEGRQGGSDDNQ